MSGLTGRPGRTARVFVCSAALLSGVAAAACSHSHAAVRCDLRAPSPESAPAGASAAERAWFARRDAVLTRSRSLYEKGMRELQAARASGDLRDPGAGAFRDVHDYATSSREAGRGAFLYEQLGDGDWVYRCDDLTRIYALAAFRSAVIYSDLRPDLALTERLKGATGRFCIALLARPDVVFAQAKRERLGDSAQRALQAAYTDSRCYIEDGFRSPARPVHHDGSYAEWWLDD